MSQYVEYLRMAQQAKARANKAKTEALTQPLNSNARNYFNYIVAQNNDLAQAWLEAASKEAPIYDV